MALDTKSAKEINEMAQKNAEQFKKDGLKTNQIRNFYSSITRMRVDFEKAGRKSSEDLESALVFLKPKLAYAAGRQKAVKEHFYKFMTDAINDTLSSRDMDKGFKNFFALVESVVAYHKFYGDN